MTIFALIVAIVCFAVATCIEFTLFGLTGEHVLGWIALGLAAFAAAHLPLPGYFRR